MVTFGYVFVYLSTLEKVCCMNIANGVMEKVGNLVQKTFENISACFLKLCIYR